MEPSFEPLSLHLDGTGVFVEQEHANKASNDSNGDHDDGHHGSTAILSSSISKLDDTPDEHSAKNGSHERLGKPPHEVAEEERVRFDGKEANDEDAEEKNDQGRGG